MKRNECLDFSTGEEPLLWVFQAYVLKLDGMDD